MGSHLGTSIVGSRAWRLGHDGGAAFGGFLRCRLSRVAAPAEGAAVDAGRARRPLAGRRGVVQVLVRREVLRRVYVEADQIAARQIQARLMPGELPTAPQFDLAARYSPVREIGGDYYEVAPIDARHWLIAMADVSGKGTGAALLTASLQALVHFAHANEPSLEATAAAMNRHLVRFAPPGRFITMVLGILDVERRRLRFVNAGHNPALGVAADGTVLRLTATGLPVGMLEPATYEAGEVDFPAGTVCLFYTDGLVERANRADEFFGEDAFWRPCAGCQEHRQGRSLPRSSPTPIVSRVPSSQATTSRCCSCVRANQCRPCFPSKTTPSLATAKPRRSSAGTARSTGCHQQPRANRWRA
jgi:hypothetical protein